MMYNVLNSMIETLKVTNNKFLWSNKPARVLIGNYNDGGLKDVDIVSELKIIWIRRLGGQ